MKRCAPALVHGVGVRPRLDEVGDDSPLLLRVPFLRGASVGGVVKRLGSSSVAGPHGGALSHQRFGHVPMMGGGGDVESGVPRVHVMADWEKEVGLCFLASGTSSERGTRQIGPLLQQPYHGRLVAICDVSKEGTQAGLTRCLIRLCHCYRLP